MRLGAVDAKDLDRDIRFEGAEGLWGGLADIARHGSMWAVVNGVNHQRAPYTLLVAETVAMAARLLGRCEDWVLWLWPLATVHLGICTCP